MTESYPALEVSPVPISGPDTTAPRSAPLASMTVRFACVLDQLDAIVEACAEIRPGSVTGPHTRPWNSVELEIHTPENVRVIMTAARHYEPGSAEAATLLAVGIEPTEHGSP